MSVCGHDGCPEPVKRGYCPTHAPRRDESRRSPSSYVTGTHRWRNLKRRVLYRDGRVCHYCGGLATTVDHVEPVHARPDLAYVDSNCVASCVRCNLTKGGRT